MEPNVWQVYKDRGLQLIGVNRVGAGAFNPVGVREFVATTMINFPVGFDLSDSYGMLRDASPTDVNSPNSVHIVIDSNGKVVYLSRFYDRDDPQDGLITALNTLLPQ